MRVAVDLTCTTLTLGGVARYALSLVDALTRVRGVEVITVRHRTPGSAHSVARIANGLLRELVYYPLALGFDVRRHRADVLHCPSHSAPRAVGRPVVLTVQDVLPWRYPNLFTRANVLHARLVGSGAIRHATRVITSTEHVKSELMMTLAIPPERIDVVPHGVATRFRPLSVDVDWIRQRFGVGAPYVLTVGTLEPRKNLLAAIRAFSLILREAPDASLLVVGPEGWGAGEIFKEAGRAPNVVLAGHVDDEELVKLYSGAACFLFPSLAEGFGLPALEAMACGTPVVCSDRPSLPEVVGDAAILVDPTDVASIAAGVLRVLEDRRLSEELRRRGRERAGRYTWDATAEATVGVYRKALSEGA